VSASSVLDSSGPIPSASPELRRTGRELLAASFAALLLELALIRWLPGRVRVIAYFPNLVLIAAFLGLGVGALLRSRSSALLAAGVLAVVGLGLGLGRIAFTAEGTGEHLWLLYYDLPRDAPVVKGVVLPIALVFGMVALTFVPLGGAIAGRIRQFQENNRTLAGYAIDLLGSLAGVLVFLGFSAGGVRPVWWFATALTAAFFSVPRRGPVRLLFLLPALGALALVQTTDHARWYSPYYAIDLTPPDEVGGISVLTNGSLHQHMMDLREHAPGPTNETKEVMRVGYHIPVMNLKPLPRRALVLGAGTGNDVAVLLDAGVPEVHAVEIDPVILQIGRTVHPARPYGDPRVIVHNTDARAFLESTDLTFDLIIFGTLDSMTRLSALGNVRLDNFVYTVESVRAAKARLAPGGGLALMFMVQESYIERHLIAILYQVFDAPPLVWRGSHAVFNRLFLAGAGFAHLAADSRFRDFTFPARPRFAPNDDWPYLYMEKPSVPPFYLSIGAVVVGISLVFLLAISAPLRRSVLQGRIDVEMMLFGAAFLLVETSFVTEMNLLFGATWRTSAIVFASLLFALLVSTLAAARRRIDARFALAGVIVSLLVVALLPLRTWAPAAELPRILFALVVCGVPVSCAGLAFAARFGAREDANTAFGWNVIGAVVGGVLELSSMLIGLHALFFLAALLYVLTLLVGIKGRVRAMV
jgi:spermidine synthase